MQRAEIQELLTKAKKLLEAEVPPISYRTWLSNIEIYSWESSLITILVATNVHKDMVSRYLDLIKNTFIYITNTNCDVRIISEEQLNADGSAIGNNSTNANNVHLGNNYHKSNLKYEYTFDSFVVGENNRFAQAAALAVSEAPRYCI